MQRRRRITPRELANAINALSPRVAAALGILKPDGQPRPRAAKRVADQLGVLGPRASVDVDAMRRKKAAGTAAKHPKSCRCSRCATAAQAANTLLQICNGGDFPTRPKPVQRKYCGARRRSDGLPCEGKVPPGKKRCKWHGGLSTGAKTPEGKQRIAEAQARRWVRYHAAKAAAAVDRARAES